MLRIHVKPAPKRFVELADEMGLMFHEEPPIRWMKDNPKLWEREEREVRELVLRDRNNASVVMWGILNETSNLGGVQIAGSVAIMHHLCLIARELDPTRIVLDDSGGYGNGTNAYLPYSTEPVGVRDMHRYGPAPITEFDYRSFAMLGQPDPLRQLSQMVQNGATAIFLEGNFNELMYLFLRFVIGHTDGRGGLGGNFHYVKPHPVFEGLPSGCLMDWEYANLWARETM